MCNYLTVWCGNYVWHGESKEWILPIDDNDDDDDDDDDAAAATLLDIWNVFLFYPEKPHFVSSACTWW